jgi:hypothetical protein
MTPQAAPSQNEPVVIATLHTDTAKPDKILTISLLGKGFGASTATNNAIPKTLKTVPKPIRKDFLFDFGPV